MSIPKAGTAVLVIAGQMLRCYWSQSPHFQTDKVEMRLGEEWLDISDLIDQLDAYEKLDDLVAEAVFVGPNEGGREE